MALDLGDCTFAGPALPEPFVKFELEDLLRKKGLLPKHGGLERRAFEDAWDAYRRSLRGLGEGGSTRVYNHVLDPLAARLGYDRSQRDPEVQTREGVEDGGWVFRGADGARLRVWAIDSGADMDAPNRRGRAYRFSPTQVACRILLQQRERVGLLTDGSELRLIVSDPAGRDSHIEIHLDRAGGWRGARDVPDSWRLILAMASPRGVAAIPDLVEAARLTQVKVTGKLREQARRAVEGFVQEVLDRPENRDPIAGWNDRQALAHALWHEGLVLVYRLLFALKLESSPDPARAFGFASSSLWRNTWSPNTALARYARLLLGEGKDTGRMLEDGLRGLFRIFCDGLEARELPVKPLGGMLFGPQAMPLLDGLHWGERAVAVLLDRLLWTPGDGRTERRRVYYGSLDVEDLGRVYESLLELEPGLSTEPMCRLRRAKLEVVVPIAQGEKYRASAGAGEVVEAEGDDTAEDEGDEDEGRGKKTKVLWIEEIPPGRFYLRVGLGRKASGSYYTPHSFVKFLVRETCEPLVTQRSPMDDPRPGEILKLKVLDPAMGSGHFLVEAARYLGDKLYEACRLCDERALEAERQAEEADPAKKPALLAKARDLRARVEDLPDPEDELLAYLPSRAPEGEESGFSQSKGLALCRRLVAVHCLYGVDKNPLAVELAKLSLWIEAHAEGMPLTFLDHRLIVGDSLTGPFFEHLLTLPGSREPVQDLFRQGLADRFTAALGQALLGVRELEKSVGVDLADVEAKTSAKAALDRAMAPFRVVAAAWAGGVMLGSERCDDQGYARLAESVSRIGTLPESWADRPRLRKMIARGLGLPDAPADAAGVLKCVLGGQGTPALPYDLAFPEVFRDTGRVVDRGGFDAVLGNPPWDAVRPLAKEFFAAFDLRILDAPTRRERGDVESRLRADPAVDRVWREYLAGIDEVKHSTAALYAHVSRQAEDQGSGATPDVWQMFAERGLELLRTGGQVGLVLPSAFHANQGATGIRELFLRAADLRQCYSFENRRKLFEIDSRFKFALVVASRPGPTRKFQCSFYRHDDDWLFQDGVREGELTYGGDFVRHTGGEHRAFLELRTEADAEVAATLFATGSRTVGAYLAEAKIRFGEEIHMTKGSHLFTPARSRVDPGVDPRDPEVAQQLRTAGFLLLHEGKTFHQFDDRWAEPPRYLVALVDVAERAEWLRATRYYRLAFRDVASSTNERTGIFCLLPPGVLFGNSAPSERAPAARASSAALELIAVGNTFPLDWTLRLRAASHVNHFILGSSPLPPIDDSAKDFLARAALRLTCNHTGYAPLWHEQVGNAWREPTPPFTWPVLAGNDDRWPVRAAIDAVVADAYGLTRDQYQHVLSTFSHKSYPPAPTLCMAAFDELKTIGLEAFTKRHDPYWDIPLNENLPKPVIDLPVRTEPPAHGEVAGLREPSLSRPQQIGLFPDDAGPLFSRRR